MLMKMMMAFRRDQDSDHPDGEQNESQENIIVDWHIH